MIRRVRLIALLLAAACTGGDAPARPAQADAPPPLPAGWVRDTLLGMAIDVPGPFRLRTLELPDDVEERLEEMQSYRARGDSVQVTVTRATYRQGMEVELRSSAEGSIAGLQALPGVTGFQVEHTPAEVSGVPALRTLWTAAVGGDAMRGEFLTLLRGRTWWQVQATGFAGARTERATRAVLASVRLAE